MRGGGRSAPHGRLLRPHAKPHRRPLRLRSLPPSCVGSGHHARRRRPLSGSRDMGTSWDPYRTMILTDPNKWARPTRMCGLRI
uniref:Uncharacterized protein n=1 Tax=Setaria viridis TaxID=4556 RepID=A0A4U6SVW3_SETVI|nr:hypothetical protein SEVIR_9G192900v2 [Setaria viridis]